MLKEPKTEKYREAVEIVKTLQGKGFETYLAGGCVRDMLMGKEPKDFDISTSAKPKEIEKIFSKTKAVGKEFGVILVLGKTGEFEVSTFRGEEEYKDARRPSKVFWVSSKEDAKRRDFTVNGLFYDPVAKKIIDFVNGQKDMEKKIIKFIGNPDERIQEDNLRILRAVRFKNILGFKYDKETEKALKKNAKLIKNVSKERVKNELDLILEDKSRGQGILDLSRLGILKYILPEIEKMKGAKQPPQFHSEGDVFEHTILSLQKLPDKVSREVAWATLLHDIGKPSTSKVREHPKYGKRITFYGHIKLGAEIADKICRRLRFSKKEREKVVFLVLEHLRHKDIPKMKVARQRKWAQNPLFPELMVVWKADSEASYLGKKGIDLSLYNYAKKLYEKEQKQPKPLKLLLNGNEVMKTLNIPSGPLVGKILRQVEEAQLENKIKTKKEALEYIKGLKIT
jgi:poly(A) polymerase